MKSIITLALTALISATASAAPVVDVTQIAGKTEAAVSAYLGAPSDCGKSKYGKKCQYSKGETEIVFINGKADWITIEGMDSIPFTKAALTALGLKVRHPSFSSDYSLKWNSIQGIGEISIFKGGSKSDYAYIKVATK